MSYPRFKYASSSDCSIRATSCLYASLLETKLTIRPVRVLSLSDRTFNAVLYHDSTMSDTPLQLLQRVPSFLHSFRILDSTDRSAKDPKGWILSVPWRKTWLYSVNLAEILKDAPNILRNLPYYEDRKIMTVASFTTYVVRDWIYILVISTMKINNGFYIYIYMARYEDRFARIWGYKGYKGVKYMVLSIMVSR